VRFLTILLDADTPVKDCRDALPPENTLIPSYHAPTRASTKQPTPSEHPSTLLDIVKSGHNNGDSLENGMALNRPKCSSSRSCSTSAESPGVSSPSSNQSRLLSRMSTVPIESPSRAMRQRRRNISLPVELQRHSVLMACGTGYGLKREPFK